MNGPKHVSHFLGKHLDRLEKQQEQPRPVMADGTQKRAHHVEFERKDIRP